MCIEGCLYIYIYIKQIFDNFTAQCNRQVLSIDWFCLCNSQRFSVEQKEKKRKEKGIVTGMHVRSFEGLFQQLPVGHLFNILDTDLLI